MPKIKIKTILIHLATFLVLCSPITGLIVRFSIYTKKVNLPDGSTKLQRVVLCGDNHVIGTPENNLRQWYSFVDQLNQYTNGPIAILVENQRLCGPWFNDPVDHEFEKLLQKDLKFGLQANEPGTLTLLSFIGLPATFFTPKYCDTINKLNITNIECRQFLSYTALLNQEALRQNISDPNLLAPFKKLQEQKTKTFTLNDIGKTIQVLDSYKNQSRDTTTKNIFAGIQQRLNHNWKHLTAQWKKEFPDLMMHQPITNLRHHYQQSHGMQFDGYTVYKLVNPFEEKICISLITTQFMDEMIEANALWHITKPDAADTILVFVGSTHSGDFDLIHIKHTLADHLDALGYQHKTSFGLENMHKVDALYCKKASIEIPQELFACLKKQ